MTKPKVTKCPPGNAKGSENSWPQQVSPVYGLGNWLMWTRGQYGKLTGRIVRPGRKKKC